MSKIKEHFKKHKRFYLGAAIGGGVVILAGITYVIMKPINITGSSPTGTAGSSPTGTGQESLLVSLFSKTLFGSNNTNIHLEQIVNSYRQGAPSWVVRCIETGEVFMSQRAAAIAKNIAESNISKHLNGLLENAEGYHFERICMAA